MRPLLEDLPDGRRRRRISRRHPARCQGAARMEGVGGSGLIPAMSPLGAGILAALATLVADQASKLWLLNVFDLARRGVVKVTPFFDLVLAWNIGISFGWLQNDSQAAQIALMAVKAIAVVALAIWMARSGTRLATVALGLIIGGAIGNGLDRLAYGAVVDFALFLIEVGGNTYNWYVFIFVVVLFVFGVV